MTRFDAADCIIKSDALFTGNDLHPHPGFVAVRGNEIASTGSLEDAGALKRYTGPGTKVVECGDRLVMPGFNDSHMHFALGAVQADDEFCVDLMFSKSEEDCLERVRKFDEAHPGDGWIYGCGWYSPDWTVPEDPTKNSLDALGIDRPICLSDFSMHIVWLNTRALEICKIEGSTPQPEGGVIRLGEDGEPNGILCEPPATNRALDIVLDVPDLASSLRKTMCNFASLGITAIGDMHPLGVMCQDVYGTYQQLADSGESTLRITYFPDLCDIPSAKRERSKHHGDKVRCGGVKYILDGAVEAYTAFMHDPYLTVPPGLSSNGERGCSQAQLNRMVSEADAAGLPVRIHAIGDAAATMVVDACEAAIKQNGCKKSRFAIEHTDNIMFEDIERMGRLGISAAVQPQHPVGGFSVGGYGSLLGPARESKMWPYREESDAGICLGLGTDWPAAMSVDPIDTIYAAVTRSSFDGKPEAGYFRENALTLGEALQAHTRGSSYVEGFENRIGTLAEGMLADIVVLNCNPFNLDIMDLRSARVDMTMFDGKFIYIRR